METKSLKETNEAFQKSAEQLSNLFNSTGGALNDMYKSQLNFAFRFYNNVFDAVSNPGKFPNPFLISGIPIK